MLVFFHRFTGEGIGVLLGRRERWIRRALSRKGVSGRARLRIENDRPPAREKKLR